MFYRQYFFFWPDESFLASLDPSDSPSLMRDLQRKSLQGGCCASSIWHAWTQQQANLEISQHMSGWPLCLCALRALAPADTTSVYMTPFTLEEDMIHTVDKGTGTLCIIYTHGWEDYFQYNYKFPVVTVTLRITKFKKRTVLIPVTFSVAIHLHFIRSLLHMPEQFTPIQINQGISTVCAAIHLQSIAALAVWCCADRNRQQFLLDFEASTDQST